MRAGAAAVKVGRVACGRADSQGDRQPRAASNRDRLTPRHREGHGLIQPVQSRRHGNGGDGGRKIVDDRARGAYAGKIRRVARPVAQRPGSQIEAAHGDAIGVVVGQQNTVAEGDRQRAGTSQIGGVNRWRQRERCRRCAAHDNRLTPDRAPVERAAHTVEARGRWRHECQRGRRGVHHHAGGAGCGQRQDGVIVSPVFDGAAIQIQRVHDDDPARRVVAKLGRIRKDQRRNFAAADGGGIPRDATDVHRQARRAGDRDRLIPRQGESEDTRQPVEVVARRGERHHRGRGGVYHAEAATERTRQRGESVIGRLVLQRAAVQLDGIVQVDGAGVGRLNGVAKDQRGRAAARDIHRLALVAANRDRDVGRAADRDFFRPGNDKGHSLALDDHSTRPRHRHGGWRHPVHAGDATQVMQRQIIGLVADAILHHGTIRHQGGGRHAARIQVAI